MEIYRTKAINHLQCNLTCNCNYKNCNREVVTKYNTNQGLDGVTTNKQTNKLTNKQTNYCK